jgi:hypothetical protein
MKSTKLKTSRSSSIPDSYWSLHDRITPLHIQVLLLLTHAVLLVSGSPRLVARF